MFLITFIVTHIYTNSDQYFFGFVRADRQTDRRSTQLARNAAQVNNRNDDAACARRALQMGFKNLGLIFFYKKPENLKSQNFRFVGF